MDGGEHQKAQSGREKIREGWVGDKSRSKDRSGLAPSSLLVVRAEQSEMLYVAKRSTKHGGGFFFSSMRCVALRRIRLRCVCARELAVATTECWCCYCGMTSPEGGGGDDLDE